MDWKNYAVCLMDLTIDRHWRCACLVTMMAAGCTFFAASYLAVLQHIREATVALVGTKYFAQMATMAGRALSYRQKKTQRRITLLNQLRQ